MQFLFQRENIKILHFLCVRHNRKKKGKRSPEKGAEGKEHAESWRANREEKKMKPILEFMYYRKQL